MASGFAEYIALTTLRICVALEFGEMSLALAGSSARLMVLGTAALQVNPVKVCGVSLA